MTGIFWAVVAGWVQGPPAAHVWTARSATAQATVGDTVWLERRFALPGGWRLRPGRLGSDDAVEALADPVVLRDGGEWVVRYPVAAWTPGPHTVTLPPVWRLGPDAQADSISGGTASFVLATVIPDSLKHPEPRPALAPLRAEARDARLPALALLLVAYIYGSKSREVRPILADRNLLLLYLSAIPILWHLWFYGFWSVAVVKEFGGGALGKAALVASFNGVAGLIGFPLGGKIGDMVAHRSNGRP